MIVSDLTPNESWVPLTQWSHDGGRSSISTPWTHEAASQHLPQCLLERAARGANDQQSNLCQKSQTETWTGHTKAYAFQHRKARSKIPGSAHWLESTALDALDIGPAEHILHYSATRPAANAHERARRSCRLLPLWQICFLKPWVLDKLRLMPWQPSSCAPRTSKSWELWSVLQHGDWGVQVQALAFFDQRHIHREERFLYVQNPVNHQFNAWPSGLAV